MKGDRAAVIKSGAVFDVAVEELRTGDVVLLQTDDVVPADLKLLETWNLEIDEFDLTGEIRAVEKRAAPGSEVLALRGSHVLRGHGKGVVVAVGEETEYGRILAQSSRAEEPKSPVRSQNRPLSLILLLLPPFLLSLGIHQDHLPVYVTYGFSALLLFFIADRGLSQYLLLDRCRRRLAAGGIYAAGNRALAEMGKVDLVCFDKTGVLTSRDIQVGGLIHVGSALLPAEKLMGSVVWDMIVTASALCHDLAYYETARRANAVDRALISFAETHGADLRDLLHRFRQIYQKPFSSEERYSACGFLDACRSEKIYFAKGDPEIILSLCQRYVTPAGEKRPFDFAFLSAVRASIARMSSDGSAVIALALGSGPFVRELRNNTFLCLLKMQSSAKPGVRDMVSKLGEWGIRSVILTGDRSEAAKGIAEDLGIGGPARSCLTGKQIEKMSLDEVGRQSDFVSVFAKLLPSQKAVLVRLLQQRGRRVAMIGDGANDALALKAADVGISFSEESSPLAKRAARILLREVTDLIPLLKAVRNVRRQQRWITLGGAALLATLILADLLRP